MTTRACVMKFGGIVLMATTSVVAGAFFSDEVRSQIARFAAYDPRVRSGSAFAWAMAPGFPELGKRVFRGQVGAL